MGKVKKVLLTLLISILVLACGAVGGTFFYIRSTGVFLDHTTINGHDVSNMTPGQALNVLKSSFDSTEVTVTENGETSFKETLSSIGFYLEEDMVLGLIRQALQVQNGDPIEMGNSFFRGRDIFMDCPSSVDEAVFTSKINNQTILNARIPNVNATLEMDENKDYQVVPEVYGTEFDDENLQYELRSRIAAAIASGSDASSGLLTEKIDLEFPDNIYNKPAICSDDPALKQLGEIYNQFSKAEIVYQFGSQTETLDWNTMKEWLILGDNQEADFDSDKITAYVEDMANRYNTRRMDRNFVTTYGSTVTISAGLNDYGYTVDQEAECNAIVENLYANTRTEREPIYYSTNSYGNPLYYQREGTDDLNGTYVEVNISAQHLWFYKNGSLIVESDFVSGDISKDRGTQTGAFPLAYKRSPDVLRGGDGNGGYETPVNYWMPFYEGQGLHDATWRGSFGGNIYQYNGSHGCVNLPLWAAASIYENISPGTAIIIYK